MLTGGLHLREAATRALGIVWLLLGVAFVGLGTLLFMNVAWWPFAAASLALLSLVMCCLNLPDARTGAALNGVLLAALGLMAAFMNGLFSFRD